MKTYIDQISFQEGEDYLDVTAHITEGWIELKIETGDSFEINNQEDLKKIYKRLKKLLKSVQTQQLLKEIKE